MNKLKVVTIFGTRPEIIRLSRVFAKLDQYVNHIMVHTGQSYDYEMDKVFFEQMKIRKPDYFLEVKADTLGKQIAKIISKSERVLKKEMPDAVLVLGDTNSALASIVAKRMKIPIFHMEAGNRCFDENVPEEINRKIVDHISDVNLPYTDSGRENLILEGIQSKNIYVTGSPLREVLDYYKDKINSSKILSELGLRKGNYFLISAHREENIDEKDSFLKLINSFNALAEKYNKPLIVSTHPRTKICLKKYKVSPNKLINFHKPFGYFDYVFLQQNALCVLSDSGTLGEESAMLGFPAVHIRKVTERPETLEAGNMILAGLDKDIILQSVDIAINQYKEKKKFNLPIDYKNYNVSDKVLRLIVGLAKIIKARRGHE